MPSVSFAVTLSLWKTANAKAKKKSKKYGQFWM
jgi:hypothetical protein